jgi:26S proteasome regulatory subunit (ATPase 3-interacting protein)
MAPTKAETKAKSDVKVLKGQDAEDLVLDYVKRVPKLPVYFCAPDSLQPTFTQMNRPYGAVDVSANLKGNRFHAISGPLF